jgi:hypothetical protein
MIYRFLFGSDRMARMYRRRYTQRWWGAFISFTEFPEGWTAVRPGSGPIELRDPSGVVRAFYGWAEDAELRILPRYLVESQANSSSGLGSLVVRDRAKGQILQRSSNWSARTGTNHPDWTMLTAWLDLHYPQHRDPFRYWKDCEQNIHE